MSTASADLSADEYSVGGRPQQQPRTLDKAFVPASELLDPAELSRRISVLQEEVERHRRWLMRSEKRLNGLERVEGLR